MFFDGSIRSMRNSSARSPTSASSSSAAASDSADSATACNAGASGASGAAKAPAMEASGPSTAPAEASYARAQRSVWKPHGTVAIDEQSANATSSGSTRIDPGSQNGVWVKCTIRRSGRSVAQHAGDERELVVLHEHDVAVGRDRRGSLRERLVHLDVGRPRLAPAVVEARTARQVEQPVVEEPQRRVRHHVVVEPAQPRFDVDEFEQHAVEEDAVAVDRARGRRGAVVGARRAARPTSSVRAVPAAAGSARWRRPRRRGRGTNDPSGARSNRYGPRFETTSTCSIRQLAEQAEPVLELPGRQEVLADVLLAL